MVRMKRVLSFFLLLYCPYEKEVCICFNTLALFLLWFVLVGWKHNSAGEYCLMSTSRIVQWSQLNAAIGSFGGGPTCKLPTCGKKCSDPLPGFKCNLLNLCFKLGRIQAEMKRPMSIKSFNKVLCSMYRGDCSPLCTNTPKWDEHSGRREPESLKVYWMAINVQYSA